MVDETNYYIKLERGKSYPKRQYGALTYDGFAHATKLEDFELKGHVMPEGMSYYSAKFDVNAGVHVTDKDVSIEFYGTPTKVENTTVQIDLNNYFGNPDRHYNFHLQVFDISITSTPQLPARLVVGQSIPEITIGASGGNGPYTYKSYAANPPPNGLTFNAETRKLYGTPEKAGPFNFWIGATDSKDIGGQDDAKKMADGRYNGWLKFEGVVEPEIKVTGNPSGGKVAGELYRDTLSASGGDGNFTFVKGKSAPADLDLNEKTGEITWKSPTEGKHSFWLGAHDKSGNGAHANDAADWKNGWYYYQVTFAPEPEIRISPEQEELPPGQAGGHYERSLSARGGTEPHTFSKTWGDDDLKISSSGRIDWTPHDTRGASFSVEVKDSKGHKATKTYHIAVKSRIHFSGTDLPHAVAGHPVEAGVTVYAYNGTSPYKYTFEHLSGPIGVIIDEKGHVSGTPDRAGIIKFKVTATDDSRYKYSGEQEFVLIVEPAVSITSSPSTLEGYVDEFFNATFEAHGGSGHYTYEIFGDRPGGLSVHGDTGALSGTPTRQGPQSFILGVAECSARLGNGINGRKEFSIQVYPGLSITFRGPSTATVGEPYTGTIRAEGGKGRYRYTVSGLRNGLSAEGNVVSGKPTAAGAINFTITVNDDHGSKSKQFQIDVSDISKADIALGKLLRGHFVLAPGGKETLTITGQVAGGGLSETRKPAKGWLKIKQPGHADFVDVETIGKLDPLTGWKADGWEFTLSGIPWTVQRGVPRFEMRASIAGHTSKAALVKLPLNEFVKNLAFRDEEGEPLSGSQLSVKPGAHTLHLHMAFYNAIDQLTAKLELPDGMTGKALPLDVTRALPKSLKARPDWDGHIQPVLFEISATEPLKIGSGSHQTVNIPIPINVTTKFRSGEAKCELTSHSDIVEFIPNETRPESATLSLQAATS